MAPRQARPLYAHRRRVMRAIIDAAVGVIGLDDDLVPEPVIEEPEEPPMPWEARLVVARKPKPRH